MTDHRFHVRGPHQPGHGKFTRPTGFRQADAMLAYLRLNGLGSVDSHHAPPSELKSVGISTGRLLDFAQRHREMWEAKDRIDEFQARRKSEFKITPAGAWFRVTRTA